MKKATDILDNSELIIADGAMGTWYVNKYQRSLADCENDNINNSELIRNIHLDYIMAGSQLIRTNTFALVNEDTYKDHSRLAELAAAGFRQAQAAAKSAGKETWTAADFGPVYDIESDQYLPAWEAIVASFVAEGAELFVLETFSDPHELDPLCRIIRKYNSKAVILASFAISADGFTRKGLSLGQLDRLVAANNDIDIIGLNCGVGPTHLRQLISMLEEDGKPLSLMPNSGYPHMENQRMVFGSTPDYFADSSLDLKHPRLRIIGGCCGTTPDHIRKLASRIDGDAHSNVKKPESKEHETAASRKSDSMIDTSYQNVCDKNLAADQICRKILNQEFIIVCELDPPKNSDLGKIISAAEILKKCNIDAITISDSPLARVKLDPIIAAARIYRETGIPVLPHLTCRDRNVNALRSIIMGAHSEGIRQMLMVTGDRIPESNRGFVKPVFNINSKGLLELAAQMNSEMFIEEPIMLAAACDLGTNSPESEFRRILEKKEAGAKIFLSQPVYHWDESTAKLARQVRDAGITLLIGLMPLVSYRNANYMDQEVPGIRIPASLIDMFSPEMSKEEAEQVGLKQIYEIACETRPFADGFYLIAPFNRAHIISEFMDIIKFLIKTEAEYDNNSRKLQ